MTTTVSTVAPVHHLPARPSAEPAHVQVCHYCDELFVPTKDPSGDGSAWDLDDAEQHCCDDCHCPKCLIGHYPNQDCPAAPDPADGDTVAREEAAAYGDPDALYDALTDARLGDCE